MKPLSDQPSRAELTYQALLDGICEGSLPPGTHLVQEELAAQLGVSRQPVQQALARLKSEELIEAAPGRGYRVSRLHLDKMRDHYQIRSALDGIAARLAAQRAAGSGSVANAIEAQGQRIIRAGRDAVRKGAVKDMVRHDVAFHACVYSHCGNPQIAPTVERHWRFLRRVMADVLRHAEPPASIWLQHEAILEAIVSGDAPRAEALAETHIERASHALAAAFNAADQNRR